MEAGALEEGDIVVTVVTLTEGAFGAHIPRGTRGVVTAIAREEAYVEFELGNASTSRPIPCVPSLLELIE